MNKPVIKIGDNYDFEKFKKMVVEFEIEPLDEEIKKANDLLSTYKAFCFLVQKFI